MAFFERYRSRNAVAATGLELANLYFTHPFGKNPPFLSEAKSLGGSGFAYCSSPLPVTCIWGRDVEAAHARQVLRASAASK